MTDVLYAAKGSIITNSDLYTVDPSTPGSPVSVGSTGFGMTGLAQHPLTLALYGATNSSSAVHPNSLVSLDTTTGAGTFIGAFGVTIADICFSAAGVLYGLRSNSDLYTINLATGVASFVGSAVFGGNHNGNGCAINSGGVFWATPNGDGGQMYTYNLSTGAVTAQGFLTNAPNGPAGFGTINALSYTTDGVTLYGIDTNASSQWNLITINTGTQVCTNLGIMPTRFDALAWASFGVATGPSLIGEFRAA